MRSACLHSDSFRTLHFLSRSLILTFPPILPLYVSLYISLSLSLPLSLSLFRSQDKVVVNYQIAESPVERSWSLGDFSALFSLNKGNEM